VGDDDPAALNLDVYDTERGRWNPELGTLPLPSDWELLPSGDAFVTRRVKAGGAYWTRGAARKEPTAPPQAPRVRADHSHQGREGRGGTNG
jgi:hypothetical protein